MRTSRWILPLLAVWLAAASFASAEDAPVYRQLMQEFSRHENRLPGSSGFNASLEALEKALQDAGLQTHRQTFNTLVPETISAEFLIDGQAVGPVYPLAPCGGAPTTTGGQTLAGPLVWVGDGAPSDLKGRTVEGAVVLMNFGSRHMKEIFALGARAVVFVSDERATQWQVSDHFSTLPISIPRLYVQRSQVERWIAPLSDSAEGAAVAEPGAATDALPQARVKIATVWKDATGINLWTVVPGQAGKTFDLGTEEAFCFSATLDTFGVVPQLSPDHRRAANAALLAQTAVDLAKSQPARSAFFVWFGSHYAAAEGSRYFFWAVDKAEKGGRNDDTFPVRAGYYREELAEIGERLALLDRPDFLNAGQGQALFDVLQLLRRKLNAWVNTYNYDLREFAIRQQELGLERDLEALRTEYRLREEKRIWNDMRRQVRDRTIAQPNPAFRAGDVVDWAGLLSALLRHSKLQDEQTLERAVWSALPEGVQRVVTELSAELEMQPEKVELSEEERAAFIEGFNRIIDRVDFARPEYLTESSSSDLASLLERHPRLSEGESRFLNRLLLDIVLAPHVRGVVRWQERFQRLVSAVRQDLLRRHEELERLLRHNASHSEVVAAVAVDAAAPGEPSERVRTFVGHLHFDFANDQAPWLPALVGDPTVVTRSMATPGNALRHTQTLARLHQEVYQEAWGAPLLTEAVDANHEAYNYSMPRAPLLFTIPSQSIQIYGYHLITAGEPQDADAMPRSEEVSLGGLRPQMQALARQMVEAPEMSIRSTLKRIGGKADLVFVRQAGRSKGAKYDFVAKGSTEVEAPAAGAILIGQEAGTSHKLRAPAAYLPGSLTRILGDGYVLEPLVTGWDHWYYAVGFDESGRVTRISSQSARRQLFYAYGGGFFRPLSLTSYDVAQEGVLLNAKNDSRFRQYYSLQNTYESVFYYNERVPFKYVANGMVLLGGSPEDTEFYGLAPNPGGLVSLPATRQSAQDLVVLNRERLEVLRQRNIINDSIELLHAEAEAELSESRQALTSAETPKAVAHDVYAASLGFRAYSPLRSIANDMVGAVVVLMILSIPFAFAMERLVFGFTTIYRQIVGFVGLFLVTFALLYLSHPAFELADAPIMIFLAFVIILLSGLVIYIVMSKFRHEIRALQGLVSKVHSAQSESSTAVASVLIGISGMRNRPLKTFLTAATIVLLTFTILVFSSFTAKLGVVESFLGQGQGPERIEVHRTSYLSMPPVLRQALQVQYADTYHVCERAAVFADPVTRKFLGTIPPALSLLYVPRTNGVSKLTAMTALQPEELALNPELRAILPAGGEPLVWQEGELPPIYLSAVTAESLGLNPGEEVKVRGQSFRYAGTFDIPRLQGYANVDETRLLPPDYEASVDEETLNQAVEQLEAKLENLDVSSFVWSAADTIAIIPFDAAADLDPLVNFVTLYPRKATAVGETASDIASVFNGPVFAKTSSEARRFFFTRAYEGSGYSEIIVPLLLGGLIIFSSLLGSIVDREREIFTYSALGLAPPDVAALFFAESSVYAVIGGMGGYLFSQVVAKILGVLAELNVFNPPEMNFSSLSSIYTILLVMLTVILSTIYPALKAGKSANPGVARKWKMPDPEGNRMRFVFPFTVSRTDLKGVLGFIREHFQSHGDASLGSFAARDIEIFKAADEDGGEPRLGIQALLSLSPFDLGIFQRFRLTNQTSDIEGIDEVVIDIERLSGPPGAWVRSNRGFIDELRNQFLLWRSLPVETVEHYRREMDELLSRTETESAAEQE